MTEMERTKHADLIKDWFGERGLEFPDYEEITFGGVSNYIFVSPIPIGYGEVNHNFVGMYDGSSMCAELIEDFPRETFSWERENLLRMVERNK